jgi:hypothetical protein
MLTYRLLISVVDLVKLAAETLKKDCSVAIFGSTALLVDPEFPLATERDLKHLLALKSRVSPYQSDIDIDVIVPQAATSAKEIEAELKDYLARKPRFVTNVQSREVFGFRLVEFTYDGKVDVDLAIKTVEPDKKRYSQIVRTALGRIAGETTVPLQKLLSALVIFCAAGEHSGLLAKGIGLQKYLMVFIFVRCVAAALRRYPAIDTDDPRAIALYCAMRAYRHYAVVGESNFCGELLKPLWGLFWNPADELDAAIDRRHHDLLCPAKHGQPPAINPAFFFISMKLTDPGSKVAMRLDAQGSAEEYNDNIATIVVRQFLSTIGRATIPCALICGHEHHSVHAVLREAGLQRDSIRQNIGISVFRPILTFLSPKSSTFILNVLQTTFENKEQAYLVQHVDGTSSDPGVTGPRVYFVSLKAEMDGPDWLVTITYADNGGRMGGRGHAADVAMTDSSGTGKRALPAASARSQRRRK